MTDMLDEIQSDWARNCRQADTWQGVPTLSRSQISWLISQAEKVQELERDLTLSEHNLAQREEVDIKSYKIRIAELEAEVKRLNGIYVSAVKGRQEFRQAYRDERAKRMEKEQ